MPSPAASGIEDHRRLKVSKVRTQYANGWGLTKFCSSHEIFTTKINNFANFDHFTKFLCHENLELYGNPPSSIRTEMTKGRREEFVCERERESSPTTSVIWLVYPLNVLTTLLVSVSTISMTKLLHDTANIELQWNYA